MSFPNSRNDRHPNSLQHYDERQQSERISNTPERMESADEVDEVDSLHQLFRRAHEESAQRLDAFLSGAFVSLKHHNAGGAEDGDDAQLDLPNDTSAVAADQPVATAPKKPARTFDEDNYDDDEEEDDAPIQESPLKGRNVGPLPSPSKSGSSPIPSELDPAKQAEKDKAVKEAEKPKTAEDVRKQLEESKRAKEEAARRSFHTMFHTLEHDRMAMVEQQRLEESEKQIDSEMGPGAANGNANAGNKNGAQGTLSSANLGASSLTLKHLIARIDQKREKVKASDAELRQLMSEVRKNRSKWASEENVHQEELYEACEKVLSELKARTEYSAPFLQRVSKREAPTYYEIIKHPMDLGTMTKKLKTLQYKSRTEFVTDLELIWNNCLKYNADMTHYLRKHANAMKKEADKLTGLIPDLRVMSRAEFEAEERRKLHGNEEEGPDESDDEPIMSSRGRKAPGKTGAKGSSKTRKDESGRDTPGTDAKQNPSQSQNPHLQLNGLQREGSETAMEGSNGFSTPPLGVPGSITPSHANGVPGSASDAMDMDGPSLNGISLGHALGAPAEDLHEDEEEKLWKQVTKKDRAQVTKERHHLFKGDRINPEEPAILRSRAGMRRWLRQQEQAACNSSSNSKSAEANNDGREVVKASETLAEGIEDENEHVNLPDYYETLAAIPDIPPQLQWIEDSEGNLVDPSDQFLRVVPPGHFTAPRSEMSSKIFGNMRQMQETRKLCSKISVIKQMQLQSQMYNNQFQKYDPEPFVEADTEPHVVRDDGPVMSPWVCRAALQRSIGSLCYHAGFEELQPSVLDVITDIAADYFQKIAHSFTTYREAPKVPVSGESSGVDEVTGARKWQPRFTNEEVVLHTLAENGHDVESLDAYVKDDTDRLATRLGSMHERMKAHLADLLRPALEDAGPDGAGAFKDGSEQFVGGDFAEQLGEDFFGFRELGLDVMSVPLHLLQSKMHSQYQAQNPAAVAAINNQFEALPRLPPVTREYLDDQIGLVKNFFLAKLHANGDEPLVEDEDLPAKQRFPKPRLPPSGKITSPRKRPAREQGKGKKRKADVAGGKDGAKETASAKKLKLTNGVNGVGGKDAGGGGVGGVQMERQESSQAGGASPMGEKDDVSAVGMMSPESL